jgi:hypothetical protein
VNGRVSEGALAALTKSLSEERLGTYLSRTEWNLELGIRVYEKNLRVSEAFYAPLQCLEVCLRNRMHLALSARYGGDWLKSADTPLQKNCRTKIQEATDKLKNPPPVGSVIAELTLGFWVGLLSRRYDETLWRECLCNVFKTQTGKRLPRKAVHTLLDRIRRFRNRVAHHEPVIFADYESSHDEILDAISWMCPETARWARAQSRLPIVAAELKSS